MSIYEKLLYLKRRAGLTTGEIAEGAGIPTATLNKLFSGQTRAPTLHTMQQLCAFFHVPLQYLTDDDLPVSHFTPACMEHAKPLFLSERERDLFYQYRSLDEPTRQILELFLRLLSAHFALPAGDGKEKKLLCFSPPALALGRLGAFADAASFRVLAAPCSPTVEAADFAVAVADQSLSPAYLPGTLLAIRRADPSDEQLGVFLVNGEGFIRKLQRRRGVTRLVPVNVDAKTLTVEADDQFSCLGTVLGAVRTCRWLRDPGRP